MVRGMKNLVHCLIVAACLCATPAVAQAACQAEYKAKRDNPLELFYDTARISGPCTVQNAQAQLRRVLAAKGQTLLKVLSVKEN